MKRKKPRLLFPQRSSSVGRSNLLADAYRLGSFAHNQLGWPVREANWIVNLIQLFRADAHSLRIVHEIEKTEVKSEA